jgi:glutamate N-acetyltransferase / amino-acid N-acetyltransferase
MFPEGPPVTLSTRPETFFRSRWVSAPEGATELDPVSLPAGFRAAGVATGGKPSGGRDVGVLVCDNDDAASAALFTRNAVTGAPVKVSRRSNLHALRGVVVNAGNANVGTGAPGIAVAEAMTRAVASGLGTDATRIGVASTGVIGVQLEQERILEGVERAVRELSPDGGADFSEAILTGDRGPKRTCLEVALADGPVVLAAQCKGAGMISPAFATMLCFLETDAVLDPTTLGRVVRGATARSFERITVDGQLSTSDSVFAFAGGASGRTVVPGSDDERCFAAALEAVLRQLALEIVADGEGAARVARLLVRGSESAVEPVARAIGNSPLVKCALHGADPNWGRILQAAGQALIDLPDEDGLQLALEIEGVPVVRAGEDLSLDDDSSRRLDEAMRAPEVEVELSLGRGDAEAELFFCDLGHEYVSFNSEYTT